MTLVEKVPEDIEVTEAGSLEWFRLHAPLPPFCGRFSTTVRNLVATITRPVNLRAKRIWGAC
jgi:hypothetical protein